MLKHRRLVATIAVIVVLCLFSLSTLGCQPQALVGPGMQLLYVSSEGSLVLADIGDPPGAKITLTELHHVGEGKIEASWSPDGERIIVRHQETMDGFDLWLYEVSSGEMTSIVQGYDGFGYGNIDWLPDGEHFVFETGTSPAGTLTVVKVGEVDPIAKLRFFGWHTWPPARDQIAYCREREVDPPTPYLSGTSGDVAIYDIATGQTTTLVEGTAEFAYYPEAWPAPDRLLVWRNPVRATSYQYELFAYNPQDPESTPQPLDALPSHLDKDFLVGITPPDLSEPFESNGQYNWSADLSHVVIAMYRAHTSRFLDAEVWVLSADGSQAFKVADDGQRGVRPLWRPGKDRVTTSTP